MARLGHILNVAQYLCCDIGKRAQRIGVYVLY
jgi:hypothetical protein